MKKCIKCFLIKSLDDFHKSKSYKDGRTGFCKECKSIVCKKYYIKNSEKIKTKTNAYISLNKEKRNLWEKEKSKNNVNFKLKKTLSHRLREALKCQSLKKNSSVESNLGCSISELKTYLESLFKPGMTWDNHTIKGWHIDHITPISSFDLSDSIQLKKACHFTNLQPLWWYDNIVKGSK